MSEKPKAKSMSFAEASGKIQADFSLDDMENKTLEIVSFVTEARTYKGNPSQISYITTADKKVGYTWSETVAKQLQLITETLAANRTVSAKVTKHTSTTGTYISLE